MNISDLLKYPELKEVIDIYEIVKRLVNFYKTNDPNIYEVELDIPKVEIPKDFTRRDLEYFKEEYDKLIEDFYEALFEDIDLEVMEKKDNSVKLASKSNLDIAVNSMTNYIDMLEELFRNVDKNISAILDYGNHLKGIYNSFIMDVRYDKEIIEKIKERNERFKPIYETKLKNLIKRIKKYKEIEEYHD
jgi:hypothetical protein